MALCDTGGPAMLLCSACGAFATKVPRDLLRPCVKQPSLAGKAALAAYDRGFLPGGDRVLQSWHLDSGARVRNVPGLTRPPSALPAAAAAAGRQEALTTRDTEPAKPGRPRRIRPGESAVGAAVCVV